MIRVRYHLNTRRLMQWAVENNLTHKQLLEKLNVSKDRLWLWRSGKSGVSADQRDKLCQITGLPEHHLFVKEEYHVSIIERKFPKSRADRERESSNNAV